MLNIDEIMNGVVIDHITAGTGFRCITCWSWKS